MKKKKKICKTILVISVALMIILAFFNPDAQFLVINNIIIGGLKMPNENSKIHEIKRLTTPWIE